AISAAGVAVGLRNNLGDAGDRLRNRARARRRALARRPALALMRTVAVGLFRLIVKEHLLGRVWQVDAIFAEPSPDGWDDAVADAHHFAAAALRPPARSQADAAVAERFGDDRWRWLREHAFDTADRFEHQPPRLVYVVAIADADIDGRAPHAVSVKDLHALCVDGGIRDD